MSEEEDELIDIPNYNICDPFRTQPKSNMNLSNCKKEFFNNKKYFDEIFPSIFDKDGYSIHLGYYKYNTEFSNLSFIRRNVVTGIIQSMDTTIAHKNLFGAFKLFTNKVLECIFITRGQEMIKECAGDMVESFDFVKLDILSDKKIISDFLSKEEDSEIEYYIRFV